MRLLGLLLVLLVPVSGAAVAAPPEGSISGSLIQMKQEGGTYVVPVLINNAITLNFTVDSGASDVTIPEDVVSTLIRAGTIERPDFIGQQTYELADGSMVKSAIFRIRSLQVGDRVLHNVKGSVAGRNGSLLLGQSFLGRFNSWSIDNTRHVLALNGSSATSAPQNATASRAAPPDVAWAGDPDRLYDVGFKLLKAGDWAGAEGVFRDFVRRYPQNVRAGDAQYWLAQSYYARRDYQNAMVAYAEGYKTYKSNRKGPDNVLKLSITLAALGRKTDACTVLARFAQDYPQATDLQKQRVGQERQRLRCE